MSKKI